MTKSEVVEFIAQGTGITRLETEAVVEGFFNAVCEALRRRDGIEIRGFGTFKVKKQDSRYARNPKTGEKVFVPERYVPIFKFSKDFKNNINTPETNKGNLE